MSDNTTPFSCYFVLVGINELTATSCRLSMYMNAHTYVQCIGAMNDIGNERLFILLNEQKRPLFKGSFRLLFFFFFWGKQQLNCSLKEAIFLKQKINTKRNAKILGFFH